MVTIGLAQGDALGGGFESLLSFNVIIAERDARFGFPENIFGLFPGMVQMSCLDAPVPQRKTPPAVPRGGVSMFNLARSTGR